MGMGQTWAVAGPRHGGGGIGILRKGKRVGMRKRKDDPEGEE